MTIFLVWYEWLFIFIQVFGKVIINDIQIEFFITKKKKNCQYKLLARDADQLRM